VFVLNVAWLLLLGWFGVCTACGRGTVSNSQLWRGEMPADFVLQCAAALCYACRVSSYVPLRTWRRAAERLAANGTHHASGRLLWGGVKEFADGSLGSSTAVFWRPYADDPSGSNTGMRLIELGDLQQLVHGAAGAGLQTAVHAIGDRAVDEVLEVFEQVEECTEGEADHQQQQHRKCMQHRVEHVQHISSSVTAAKLAVLGLHAVPNPQHLISDRALLVRKLGQERAGAGRTHAYRTLATMGVSMGFASDWPVVEVDPFASVYASVFRKAPPAVKGQSAATHDGSSSGGVSDGGSAPIPQPPPMPEEQAWAPEESMPLEVALQLHTATAAKVARLDQWAGELRPGLRGDFIVLDRSPFEGMDEYGGGGFGAGLPQVVKTYVDGRCVYGCDGGDVAGSGLAVADSEGVSR
jgi:predicted amidohydrolase YtcJ